jgi:hypothetical protein
VTAPEKFVLRCFWRIEAWTLTTMFKQPAIVFLFITAVWWTKSSTRDLAEWHQKFILL